jgi:CRP-like cAMP-binding protein
MVCVKAAFEGGEDCGLSGSISNICFAWGGEMENRLLQSLTASDLALLEPRFKRVQLLDSTVLQEEDAPVEWIYFPLSGAVSLLMVMKGGEAAEIAGVGRDGAVGLFAKFGPWQAGIRAVVRVSGLAEAIPSSVFGNAVDQSRHIRDLMFRYKEALWAQTQRIAACNALHSVEQRIARWLLQMSDRIDCSEIPVTQDVLSQMLGVRRTTVTFIAQKLQHAGLIYYRRGHIRIDNRDALQAIACECYDAWRQADTLSYSTPEVEHSA